MKRFAWRGAVAWLPGLFTALLFCGALPAASTRTRHLRQRLNLLEALSGSRPSSAGVLEGIRDIDEVLSAVMGQARLGGGSTEASLELVDGMTKEMLARVEAFHRQEQGLLARECGLLAACAAGLQESQRTAGLSQSAFEAKSSEHRRCRVEEAKLAADAADCLMLQRAQQQLKDASCRALAEYEAQAGDELRHQAAMDKRPGEDVEAYLERLGRHYCDQGGLLPEYYQREEACTNATSALTNTVMGCKAKAVARATKKATCDAAHLHREACGAHAGCRASALRAYGLAKAAAQRDVADRKVEWRALRRMRCMLDVLAKDAVRPNEERLEACRNVSVYNTSHLDVDYTCGYEEEPACEAPGLYPGSEAYKALLAGLPPGAPARPVEVCEGAEGGGLAAAPAEREANYKFYRLNVPKLGKARSFLCVAEWAMYRDDEQVATPAAECGVAPCAWASGSQGGIWATKYAFDGDESQDHAWCADGPVGGSRHYGWLSYEFPLPTPVDRMRVVWWGKDFGANGTWTIDASDDGESWATLRTLDGSGGFEKQEGGTYAFDGLAVAPALIPPGRTGDFLLEAITSAQYGSATTSGCAFQLLLAGEWTPPEVLCYQAQRAQPCRRHLALGGWPAEVRLLARGRGRWGLRRVSLAYGGDVRALLDSPAGVPYAEGSRFWLDGEAPGMGSLDLRVPEGA